LIIADAPNDAALLKAIQGQFTPTHCQDEHGAPIEGLISAIIQRHSPLRLAG
jgi:hypothetical protein